MKTSEVTAFYETKTAAARALGIDQSSIHGWGDYPPDRRQLQIERLTAGALKAEPGCLERALGLTDNKTEAS